MHHAVSRRAALLGLATLSILRQRAPAHAAARKAAEFDDPFLGQTTQGDLILAPGKTTVASALPEKPRFFGVVRKTNILRAEKPGDKINMLMLFAAFDCGDCELSLCSLTTLEGSDQPMARRAAEALIAVARRVKERPDSIYVVQDIDNLPADSCRARRVA